MSLLDDIFPTILTPSQTAGRDLLDGMQSLGHMSADPAQPVKRDKKGPNAKGLMMGLQSAIQKQMPSEGMDIPVPQFQISEPVQLPGYANGGEFDDEEPIVVGEDGPEVIQPLHGGGGRVIPLQGHSSEPDAMPTQGTAVIPTPGQDAAALLRRQKIEQARGDLEQAQQVSHAPYKGFLYGMAQGLSNALSGRNAPIQTYDDLKRQRKSREPMRRLGMLEEQDRYDSSMADAAQKRALQQAEIGKMVIQGKQALTDLQYDQLVKDPLWAVVEQTKTLTPEQADYFNKKLNSEMFQPGYWGGFEEMTDPATGKRLVRRKDTDPRYVVNPTVSPDATVPPVNVKVGNIPLTLKQPQVGELMISENEHNAQRTQATNQFNASQQLEALKANVTNQFNYSKALYDQLAEMGKTNAEAQSALTAGQGLYQQMAASAERLQSIDPESDAKEYAAEKKNFDDLQEKFYQQVAKTQAGSALIQQLAGQNITRPASVTYQPIAPVRTQSITAGKIISKTAVQRAARDHKVSYTEAAKQAQAQGYTIQ